MSKGRRYNGEEKLNYKKVVAVIAAIAVIIMFIFIIKNLVTKAKETDKTTKIGYFALYDDEKWGVINEQGEIVIAPTYQEMITILDSSKDVFLCTYDINEETGEYKTKVVNKKNEEIYTNYDKVEAIENYDENENVWYEKDVLKVEKDGKYGLIDIDGKELIAPKYSKIEAIKGIENSLIVEENGLLGLVNNKGNVIIEPKYKEITNFGKDYQSGYIVINEENKSGLISFAGTELLKNEYEKIDKIVGENYYVIEESGKQKLINISGEKVIEDGFDQIKEMTSTGIIYEQAGKFGFMQFNKENKIEAKYEDLKSGDTENFIAKQNGKYGIININQESKIGYEYKDLYYNQKAGIYVAEKEDYTSDIIDTEFNIKLTGILSELNDEKGYMKIKKDGEYKYYNFKFEEKNVAEILTSNTIFVSKKDGKYGYVDKDGNQVVECIYDDATEANEYGYAAIKQNGVWGSINSKGEVIIEPKYNLDANLVINFIGKWHLGADINMNYYCEE